VEADNLIKKLNMISHPEGGHYVENFKNNNVSQIYYLLKSNEKSHWHRLTKNEILHFYSGDPLEVFTSSDGIDYDLFSLGSDDNYIYTVKANTWFAMRSAGSYSLIGCTVAPAFNFIDFELAPATWRPKKFKIEL
jgi:predicted cupin superfamily sugar epimerase|tara:strand:- start:261 stop:665 length:405 start_codon:yes stop_codon:yes gene_type:complete